MMETPLLGDDGEEGQADGMGENVQALAILKIHQGESQGILVIERHMLLWEDNAPRGLKHKVEDLRMAEENGETPRHKRATGTGHGDPMYRIGRGRQIVENKRCHLWQATDGATMISLVD